PCEPSLQRSNARESSSDSTVAKKLMSDNPSDSSIDARFSLLGIFDVFDAGVMAGISLPWVRLERGKRALSRMVIKFKIASVKGFRRVVQEGASVREALVKW
ncbi:Putative LOC100569581, partial [Caligus rogercresseyi]